MIISAVIFVLIICHWRNVGNVTRWLYVMKIGNRHDSSSDTAWRRMSFDTYRRMVLVALPVDVLAFLFGIYLLIRPAG